MAGFSPRDQFGLTAQAQSEGQSSVTLNADTTLVQSLSSDIAPWTLVDGGGNKVVQSVVVTSSAVILDIGGATLSGSEYTATFAPPPYSVQALDGRLLKAGSWVGEIVGV